MVILLLHWERGKERETEKERQRGSYYLMLTVLLPNCSQVRTTAITTQVMQHFDTITQIRGMVTCVMS